MQLSIGELARRAGISASSIRYWERIGVLSAPDRVHGRRQYGAEAIVELEVVRLGKEAGFTLAELRELIAPRPAGVESADWQGKVVAKRSEIRERRRRLDRTERLLEKVLACACEDLRACLVDRLDLGEAP